MITETNGVVDLKFDIVKTIRTIDISSCVVPVFIQINLTKLK